jgi:hypothetical protein
MHVHSKKMKLEEYKPMHVHSKKMKLEEYNTMHVHNTKMKLVEYVEYVFASLWTATLSLHITY